jgi:SAM-dependent methyltransferase
MSGEGTSMSFPDHFSPAAEEYARFRPLYPATIFDQLSALAPARGRCWDVATGSGQAAVALAERFDVVIATDASAAQLAQAVRHPRVEYRVEQAERSSLAEGSVDLIAIAAALHWFDLEPFYREVRRVGRPGSIFAAWSYGTTMRISPEIDRLVERYAGEHLAPYWPPEFKRVQAEYRELSFPFEELALTGPLEIRAEWTLAQLLGAMSTWSAATRFRAATGVAAIAAYRSSLAAAWGPPEARRSVSIPIFARVGRL